MSCSHGLGIQIVGDPNLVTLLHYSLLRYGALMM